MNEGFAGKGLYLFDRLTDAFPESVPARFQRLFLKIVGSSVVSAAIFTVYRRRLRRIASFRSMLVIADVGIGDAVIVQRSVSTLRSLYPDSRIDYVCSRTGGEVLTAMPAADHVFPIFDRNGAPSDSSYGKIREIIGGASYTVVLNLSPFLKQDALPKNLPVVNLYIPLASHIVRLWRSPGEQRHISVAVAGFLEKIFEDMEEADEGDAAGDRGGNTSAVLPGGNEITLTDEAIDAGEEFLRRHGIAGASGLVFHNPDATTEFSLIPFPLQVELLRRLAAMEEIPAILIGAGYSQQGIEQRLLNALPPQNRSRFIIVSHVPLSQYAAILDACDVFVSGDGGPAHLAASWKYSRTGNRVLRNRTAIFTVFGGTDAQMYGYDSFKGGFVPAHQAAPSRVFVAPAACRNITCVDKLGKSCREVRCFKGLQIEEVSQAIAGHLQSLRTMRHSA